MPIPLHSKNIKINMGKIHTNYKIIATLARQGGRGKRGRWVISVLLCFISYKEGDKASRANPSGEYVDVCNIVLYTF